MITLNFKVLDALTQELAQQGIALHNELCYKGQYCFDKTDNDKTAYCFLFIHSEEEIRNQFRGFAAGGVHSHANTELLHRENESSFENANSHGLAYVVSEIISEALQPSGVGVRVTIG